MSTIDHKHRCMLAVEGLEIEIAAWLKTLAGGTPEEAMDTLPALEEVRDRLRIATTPLTGREAQRGLVDILAMARRFSTSPGFVAATWKAVQSMAREATGEGGDLCS